MKNYRKDILLNVIFFPFAAGIEPTGNRVLRPAVFTVDTFSAGQGQVTVYLDHPDGTREEVRVISFSLSFFTSVNCAMFFHLLGFSICVAQLGSPLTSVCVFVLTS